MRILQIANYFSGSKVYKNLFKLIDSTHEQFIYNAVRSRSLINSNSFELSNENSEIYYNHILSAYTRLNFYAKVKKIYNDLSTKVNIENFNIIHAHTWFSDGAVAYELNKKFNIPYIVAIRSTDINLFLKYMLHLRGYGRKILENSESIIFISPNLKEKLFSHPLYSNREDLKSRSVVIPNGIDPFWIANIKERKLSPNRFLNVLYVGTFLKRKNVVKLIEAVRILQAKGLSVNLKLIGGGGNFHSKVLSSIKGDSTIKFLGEITNKEEVCKHMSESDIFAMPSFNETFGLVYIEALSQGIPIIYTKGDGIDGYYGNDIGESVISADSVKIAEGIEKIMLNYSDYRFDPSAIAENHNWDNISKKYLEIYAQKARFSH